MLAPTYDSTKLKFSTHLISDLLLPNLTALVVDVTIHEYFAICSMTISKTIFMMKSVFLEIFYGGCFDTFRLHFHLL